MRYRKVRYTGKLLEPDYIDKLLKMSRQQRKKEKIIFKTRNERRHIEEKPKKKKTWNRDLLAEYLKKKEIKSFNDLVNKRIKTKINKRPSCRV